MNASTSLPGRLAALAVLALVIGLLINFVARPLFELHRSNADSVIELREQIAQFNKIARRLPALQASLKELQGNKALESYLLPQTSVPLAAASLQEMVRQLVEENSGTLTSSQVLPAIEDHGFWRIGVNVGISVSTPGMQKILYSLEANSLMLFIDNFSVIPLSSRSVRGERPLELELRFDLSAYIQPVPTTDNISSS